MKIAEQNLSSQQVNKNFMQKKDLLTNQKDATIAEEQEDKRLKKDFMILFAQLAACLQKFLSNLWTVKKCSVETAIPETNSFSDIECKKTA